MSEELFLNGVNGATGEYLLPSLPAGQVARVARGEPLDSDEKYELTLVWRRATQKTLGLPFGVDPLDLAQAGWGVVFANDADPAIREALKPLLDLRREQASTGATPRYREFAGVDGHRPAEGKVQFLPRHGVGPGPVKPEKVPYYLLVVGNPQRVPYRFQYQLDVQYAVGRLDFDTPDEYARYAESVVKAEKARANGKPRRAVLFGVRNPGDAATKLSATQLVEPLGTDLRDANPAWEVETVIGSDATKQRLGELLGGARTPSVLLTASHGMGFPKGDARQRPHQGALLCQDWKGPLLHRGPIGPELYFSADDVGTDATVSGMMCFHFACYGAGTPLQDEFVAQAVPGVPAEIADAPFVARLPQRLLAHEKGSALAVIGHVERAWTYSFSWPRAGEQTGTFKDVLERLMAGQPVGHAMDCFNMKYAELASDLSNEREEIGFGKVPDDALLSGLWTAQNDARNYVILGDPAVRFPT